MNQNDIKIKAAIDEMQASMLNLKPTLIVAPTAMDVIGITTVHPTLRSYCVSKEHFERSGMGKTWQGKIVFLDGGKNETNDKQAHKAIRENIGAESQGDQRPCEETGGEKRCGIDRQLDNGVQKQQRVSKTGKR